jgi:hypothetical protein
MAECDNKKEHFVVDSFATSWEVAYVTSRRVND